VAHTYCYTVRSGTVVDVLKLLMSFMLSLVDFVSHQCCRNRSACQDTT